GRGCAPAGAGARRPGAPGDRGPRRAGGEVLPEPPPREDRLPGQPVDLRRPVRGPGPVHGRGAGRAHGRAPAGGRGVRAVKSPRDIVIRPVVSEKSYGGIERNAYTFLV